MPDLTLVTYNLWGYHTPAEYLKRRGEVRGAIPDSPAATLGPPDTVWQKRRACLLRVLAEADADLIALVENARRPDFPERSHAQLLGRALGMTVVEGTFQPDFDAQGRPLEVGVALLSHHSIEAVQEAALPYRAEERLGGSPKALQVTVDFEDYPVSVWVTHFPANHPDIDLQCAETLSAVAGEFPSQHPLLLCGDLNSDPDSPPLRRFVEDTGAPFRDAWTAVHPHEAGFTMATPEPSRRIDYVLFRAEDRMFSPVNAERIGDAPDAEGFFPSDHCGVRVVFRDSRSD